MITPAKTTILLIVFILSCNCSNKQSLNTEALRNELDSILLLDQKYRSEIISYYQQNKISSPELQELQLKQHHIDSSNLIRVEKIIEEVEGYPGKSLVGEKASSAVFYVLQHAPDHIQNKYYEMIVKAGKEGELNKRQVAMYQDRYLLHRGEPQIYGTQIYSTYTINEKTQERIDSTYLWPIADTVKIDSVRMWNGLEPLEDYLKQFGLSRWE